MSFFTSSEQRTRHTQIDLILGNAHEMLNDPAVQQIPEAMRLTPYLNRYYVPNVRHGAATIPRSYKNNPDALPVTSLHGNETLHFTGAILDRTTEEIDEADRLFAAWGIDEKPAARMQDTFTDGLRNLKLEIGLRKSTVRAKVRAPALAMGLENAPKAPSDILVYGKPITIFHVPEFSAKTTPVNGIGLTAIHELVHVQQVLSKPVINLKKHDAERLRLSYELEAYWLQNVLSKTLINQSPSERFRGNTLLHSSAVQEIESIRSQENNSRKNPFEPTKRLSKRLSEIGLDI